MSEPLRVDREQLYASGWLAAVWNKPPRDPVNYTLVDSDEDPDAIYHAAYIEGAMWKAELDARQLEMEAMNAANQVEDV